MKISKWAYSIEEGPIEPVYVYEAPVRFWHWAQCAAFFMLVITGFLIGWPPLANYATTWDTYFFGHIIMLHLVCGMLFAALMLYRIYWAFVGNKYSRMIFILPFWDMEWIKGIFGIDKSCDFRECRIYSFRKEEAASYFTSGGR